MVLLGPERTAGYSLAVRTGLGADWRVTPAFAIGLSVRTLTPLDGTATTAAAGAELVLRMVLTPASLK